MSDNEVDKPIEVTANVTENKYTLCKNIDCDRFPPDWDTEETYQEDPWQKCNLCDGYYNNDAGGDILYVQEEPNNQEAECSLCGKTKDIVQMKGSGEYICGNACDESDDESDDEEEEEEDDKRKCETCDIKINTDDIIELGIEVNGHNLKLCLCNNCFQDKADILRKEGWNVDNLFEDEEAEEAEEAEDETESSDESNDETESNDESNDETDVIIEQCKTLCSNWLIHNNIRMSNIEHIETSINKITHRSHFSNMMFSHICMIIPCIWWIRIDNPTTMNAVLYSKLMSMVMIVAIIASYIYHYYNECVLCSAETTYNKFAILCLNIYMYLRNVSIFYIVPGFTLLYALHKSLEYSNSQNKDFYELYHPFCHYIAGLYIYYCVWNLENAQPKLCDTPPNNIMYNDIYSGVNYPEIRI